MDKNQILEVLEDWNFWKRELKTGIRREKYLNLALRFLKPNVVPAIIGVRRSGKSFLMRQLIKELEKKGKEKRELLIINFEDKRFTELNLKLLDKIYEVYLEVLKPKEKPYIFLDEIHKVPQWEKWVRTFQELDKAKLIISDSSSKLMSGELATVLTGRHLDVVVFPLNFREFLYFKNLEVKDELDLTAKRIPIKSFFKEYLEFGGFPEVVLSEEKKQLLLTYFDDIITKDIEKRYEIREKEKLRALAKFYLTNISRLITFNSLKKFLDLSTDTIEKFSSYLEEAYLIFFVKRFSFKVKEQEKTARKVYSIDAGLARAVGFRFSKNLGADLENLAALELKRKISLNPEQELYYWKNPQGYEVDFVVKEGPKVKQLIQVCYDPEDYGTKKRELRALVKAAKELKCKELLMITEEYSGEEEFKGKKIKFVPLWEWMLRG